jgi:hypothetical protein
MRESQQMPSMRESQLLQMPSMRENQLLLEIELCFPAALSSQAPAAMYLKTPERCE